MDDDLVALSVDQADELEEAGGIRSQDQPAIGVGRRREILENFEIPRPETVPKRPR